MNPSYEDKIRQSREAGFSDEEIFNKLKSSPEISRKYSQSEQQGIASKQVDSYVKEKYGLNFKTPKTFLQKAFSALSYNPHAELLESVIGRNPVSESLKEAQQSFATAPLASLLSAPQELAHAPENILKASEEFHGGENPGFLSEGNVGLRSIIEPGLQLADKILGFTGLKDLTKKGLSFEEAIELFRQPEEAPKTHAGKATERIGAGAGIGGPFGAILGGVDYIAEMAGMSPEQRAIMPLFIGKVPSKSNTILAKGKIISRERINNVNDLAARLVSGGPDNVNVQTLKAAYDLGMPVENIPMQALYKTGLPNLMEGISQNSFFTANKFNNLLENFTNEMTSRVNEVVDSMPIDVGAENITTKEQIGEPTFNNFLPQLFESAAPQLEIPKHETGKIGTNAIKLYDEDITDRYKALYDEVKFNANDLVRPSSSEYDALQKTVRDVKKKLQSKGFKGAERREALGVLSEINELFKLKESTHPVTGEIVKEKPNIKLEHIRKNIQDLNKTISYEHPSLVNLLEPVASKMREIMDSAAQEKPHLNSLIEANSLFREKAQFFNDPLMKKLLNMTDEQFYRTIRNQPSYLKKFSEFAEKTGQTQSLNDLKGKIMADVLEGPLKASSPREMVNAITDKVVKETRELEPFYPELKGLSKSLQDAKKLAAQFQSPSELFKSKIRQRILEDIMSDSDFSDTLNLMNSPKGIYLVRETLKGSPQGQKLLKTLERKKVEECLYKGPQKQEIDLVELGEAFKNPKTDAILETLLPSENYKQAKNLSKIAEQYQRGLESHKGLKYKFEKGVALGLVPALFMAPVKTTMGISTFAYYMTSKNFKKSLVDNAKKQFDLVMETKNKKTKTNKNKTQHTTSSPP